jgi:hypothetical protein
MAAKEKKKRLSGVAKLVKTFLKRKSKPKLPSPKKAKVPEKPVSRKPKKIKIAPKAKVIAKPAVQKPAPLPPKPFEPKKSSRFVSQRAKRQLPHPIPYPTTLTRNSSLSGPRYFFNTDIPDSYNETYMRAIPRDPQWLFAYWEICDATRKELRGKMGESAFTSGKRILRLLDITDISYDGSNAQRFIDIEINEFANNWYVQVPESGRSYVLELGLLTTTGRFYLVTKSNIVTVPRMGVSPLQDEEWATVSTDELIRMSADAMRTGMGSSERRFAAAETLVGHAGLSGSLGSGSGSGGLGDFSSGSRY